MRSFGRTATSIWRDEDFLQLSPEARFVYMMLYSQGTVSAVGLLEVTLNRFARNTGYSIETVQSALDELQKRDYILVDYDTEELFVRTFVKWDGGANNDLRRKAIRDASSAAASDPIRAWIASALDRVGVPHDLSRPHPPVDNQGKDRASKPPEGGLDTLRLSTNPTIKALSPSPSLSREGEPYPKPYPGPMPKPSGSAEPPSMNCSKHPDGTEEPCGPCGTAKKRYAKWVADSLDADVKSKAARAAAIRECADCDDVGMRVHPVTKLPLGRCDHRPQS